MAVLMFMDEIDSIDRGMAIDSGFARRARETGPTRRAGGAYRGLKVERAMDNPAANRINTVASINDLTGKPWWDKSKAKST